MSITDLLKEWYRHNVSFFEDIKIRRLFNQRVYKDYTKLYDQVHQAASPIFVLSTGRCGTALLTEVLDTKADLKIVHNPFPEPTYHANWAYHNQFIEPTSVSAVVDAMRYDEIRNAFVGQKKYIETNNRITFFAYALAELYPSSKFIHIYRDANKFVRSGVNRNWYSKQIITDEGRLMPDDSNSLWLNYSQVEKIAWLWQTTNKFIETFKSTIDSSRVLTVASEDLFTRLETWGEIGQFVGVELSSSMIQKKIKKPTNKQNRSSDRNLTSMEIMRIEELTPLMNKYYNK